MPRSFQSLHPRKNYSPIFFLLSDLMLNKSHPVFPIFILTLKEVSVRPIFVFFTPQMYFWAQFFSTWKRVNCGKISQNFSKLPKIFPHVEKFQLSTYDNFVAKSVIHAVVARNFCHNLRAFMWRKIEPKSTFVEKKWHISGLSRWAEEELKKEKSSKCNF